MLICAYQGGAASPISPRSALHFSIRERAITCRRPFQYWPRRGGASTSRRAAGQTEKPFGFGLDLGPLRFDLPGFGARIESFLATALLVILRCMHDF